MEPISRFPECKIHPLAKPLCASRSEMAEGGARPTAASGHPRRGAGSYKQNLVQTTASCTVKQIVRIPCQCCVLEGSLASLPRRLSLAGHPRGMHEDDRKGVKQDQDYTRARWRARGALAYMWTARNVPPRAQAPPMARCCRESTGKRDDPRM